MNEARLTTLLLKKLRNDRSLIPKNVWVEVKQIKRPRSFAMSKLSDKAKRLLNKDVLTYKFSDMAGATPLDFIHVNGLTTYLCLIWHKPYEPKVAYFIRPVSYKNTKSIKEEQAKEWADHIIKI